MYIQQLYTSCLSEAAYYVESQGEAAIIDPLRDIDAYLELAAERKATIKYIFETHFHADFVSGHLDLAKATGAPIIYGPEAKTHFPIQKTTDGEVLKLGALEFVVLHTPGHTLESTCYLLKDEQGADHCLFTGDTLFVGDVGRPDLAQKGNDLTMEDLAGMLFDSIQQKIRPLADNVIVYPAHGPGSACGKSLGPNTSSTIGDEKATNYAMKATTKAEFIAQVTEGIAAPPNYFPVNARINKEGYDPLQTVIESGLTAHSVETFKSKMNAATILLDTRAAATFTQGFVPGSISIGLEGRFAEWAGGLLPFNAPILLITEPGKEKESIIRLARVGFHQIEGHLQGGFEAWVNAGEEADLIIDVEADELMMDIPHDPNLVVVDVRRESEFAGAHLKDAVNMPLSTLIDPASMVNIEDQQNLYVHCAGGYRSVIAASMLKRQGFHQLRNVLGGWSSITKEERAQIVKEPSPAQ